MKVNIKIQRKHYGLFLFIALFAGLGSYLLINSFAATSPPANANLWIDPSGGSCTRSASLAAYSDVNACGNFSEAFLAASCGDRIYVKGSSGSYSQQQLLSGHTSDSTHPCAEILIAATPNETVNVDDLVLGGANNIRIAGAGVKQSTGYGVMNIGKTDPSIGSPDIRAGNNVAFDGINYVSSGQIVGGTNVTVENSDIGPFSPSSCPGAGMPIGNNSSTPVKGLTFKNNYVHDYRFTNCTPPNDHLDCIHVYASLQGPSLFEGNKIENCQNYGILMEGTSNVIIRNNWFGSVVTNCGFAFHGGATTDNFTDVTIEFNSATSCITPQTTNNLTNVIMRGNIASNVGGVCRSGITYSYNKQSDGGSLASNCGTGDATSINPRFVNSSTGSLDLHLQASSTLIDAGGSVCPASDYDSTNRPNGNACDPGSDEVGATSNEQTANLWVNSTAGSSPSRCNTFCAYDPAKAYGGLNDAYMAASPGDTILVKAGNYGDQNIRWDDTKTSNKVIIRAENGATPVLGSMGVEASNVSVIGPFTSTSLETNGSGGHTIANVTVESFTVNGGAKQVIPGYVASANGVTWKNVDISNVREVQAVIVDGGPGGGAQNITFDHLVAHDDFIALGSSNHTECLGLFGGWDITVKNSLFYRCTTFDIFVTWNDTQTGTNNANRITLENNVFEEPYDSGIPPIDAGPANYAVKWITPDPTPSATRGAIIRNNTFGSLLSLPGSSTSPAPVVTGNIFTGGSCAANTTYRYNVTTSQSCGTGDTVSSEGAITAGYIDPSSHNWSLKSGSPAIGKADPSNFPILDIIGTSRPQGSAPDAGAYEYQGTSPSPKPGDTNNDGLVNIVDLSTLLSHYNTNFTAADFNKDNIVNITDLSVLLSNFGK